MRLASKSHNPQFAVPAWGTRLSLLLVQAGRGTICGNKIQLERRVSREVLKQGEG